MVEVFKSPVNLQKEATVREIATTSITVGANSSARVTIAFTKTYANPPFVIYNLTCNDEKFGLTHYLKAVTAANFIIVVENQDLAERTVVVTYQVSSN